MKPPRVTAEYMHAWGKHTHGSPLYARLVEVIAGDPELLRIINRIEHRPPPNLLFAAVQYLLIDGAAPDLAEYYRSLTGTRSRPTKRGLRFVRSSSPTRRRSSASATTASPRPTRAAVVSPCSRW